MLPGTQGAAQSFSPVSEMHVDGWVLKTPPPVWLGAGLRLQELMFCLLGVCSGPSLCEVLCLLSIYTQGHFSSPLTRQISQRVL